MAKHGKSYNAAAEKIDRATLYTPLQAAKLIKELDTAKFDETIACLRPQALPKADQKLDAAGQSFKKYFHSR